MSALTGRATRRAFLAGGATAAGTFLFPMGVGLGAEEDTSFLLIGDWGSPSGGEGEVARAMATFAAKAQSRFVISLGDNFYNKGVASTADPRWILGFEDIFAANSLQIPWYVILGNHDYEGNIQAQIDYSKVSSRWRMPAAYYTHRETLADAVQ